LARPQPEEPSDAAHADRPAHEARPLNIYTADVARPVDWYERVLGLPAGDRPPFSFPDAWLSCGDVAAVHLIGVETQPAPPANPQLEHFAFTAVGLKDFLARLEGRGFGREGPCVF
jgi:hypothetical protein